MELERELAIGTLNLLIAGFAGYSKNFVVIAFYFAGQMNFPE